MSYRSADASIKGYYYQFLRTVEAIYSLKNNSDIIKIEGIEDIDISNYDGTNYVQCKYLSSKKYSYPNIREPIIEMLNHYVANPTNNNTYTLFAHFEDKNDNSTISFNLNELKKVLTYKAQNPATKKYDEKKYHEEHTISDVQLTEFAALLSVVLAKEFDSYQSDIIELIKKEFGCSPFSAEHYYFNNSVKTVLDYAIKRPENERKVTKVDFRYKVDCHQTLFNEWYKHHKGKDKYIAFVKKEIQQSNILSKSKERLLYLGNHFSFFDDDFSLVNLISFIVDKYYLIGKVDYRTKPFTIVASLNHDQQLILKQALIKADIRYNDGHENMAFSFIQFREAPIKNTSNRGQIIIKSSFHIRIISEEVFLANHSYINLPFSIIYMSNTAYDRNINCNQLLDIKYIDNLKQVYTLLN